MSLSDPLSWGLNPLFWCHVKLCVKDIHLLTDGLSKPRKKSSQEPHLSYLSSHTPENIIESEHRHILCNKHPINQVHIVGVVVAKTRKINHTILTVDDGTGVIDCTFWTNEISDEDSEKSKKKLPSKVDLGVLVRVMGKLKMKKCWNDELELVGYTTYNGRVHSSAVKVTREVTIDMINVVEDANEETYHWLSCLELFRTVYEKPFESKAVPKLLHKSVGTETLGIMDR
mmetsp:Transcript_10729/g.14008  ORF Transcript_10729/g.14008 Transcript_10729/m.14008 type:complete len:229 (+) Transcript_10729:125-811(+)